MRRERRAWAVVTALAALATAAGGCNLIFGVTGGVQGSVTGSGGATATATHSGAGTGGTGNAGTGTGGLTPVVVNPSATEMLALTTFTFTAMGGGGNGAVTWSVMEAGGGTITAAGTYTAPAAGGIYHVVATSVADASLQGDAIVVVEAGAMMTPATLVATGELADATGNGTQSHLAYAVGTEDWWLFHDPSGASQIATAHSQDFVTWTTGSPIQLPLVTSGFGRDLAVAYANIQGTDVVHMTQAVLDPLDDPADGGMGPYGRYHIRATLSPGQISPGTPYKINFGGQQMPDGSATVILPSGTVIDSTGDEPTPDTSPNINDCGGGDVDLYTSTSMDDGSTSTDVDMFDAPPQVAWCVPDTVDARQLVAVVQDGQEYGVHLHVDGAGMVNILVEVHSMLGTWSPDETMMSVTPPSVFPTNKSFDINDWTAAVVNTQIHVVRRLGGSFEHEIVTLTGSATGDPIATAPGGSIPPTPTLGASGLFLAPYGDGLILLALGSQGSTVIYTAYDGVSSWSPWALLVMVDGSGANYLSGFAPASPVRPAVIWTQPAGTSFGIAGVQLP